MEEHRKKFLQFSITAHSPEEQVMADAMQKVMFEERESWLKSSLLELLDYAESKLPKRDDSGSQQAASFNVGVSDSRSALEAVRGEIKLL